MLEVMKEEPERCHNLQFTILQILPKIMSQDDVIRTETLWKDKLLTEMNRTVLLILPSVLHSIIKLLIAFHEIIRIINKTL